MKYHFLSIIIIFLFSSSSIGQQASGKTQGKLIFSPGVSYQGQMLGELNLMYSKLTIETGGNAIWGPRLGMEFNFNSDKFIYAPKVGYEFAGLLVAFRGNLVSYVDKGYVDLRILPEIGLSLFGAVDLTYGYGLPVLNFESNAISRHRVTLVFNLDRELWEAL